MPAIVILGQGWDACPEALRTLGWHVSPTAVVVRKQDSEGDSSGPLRCDRTGPILGSRERELLPPRRSIRHEIFFTEQRLLGKVLQPFRYPAGLNEALSRRSYCSQRFI